MRPAARARCAYGLAEIDRDATRERVRAVCLSLPEATQAGDRHLGFSVRRALAFHCKAAAGENLAIVERERELYFLPPYLAHRGWVGAWLDVEGTNCVAIAFGAKG